MKFQKPQLPTQLDDVTDLELQDETTYENMRLQNGNFAGIHAANISFDECELIRPIFSGTKLLKLQLRDVCINGGDMTALVASDSGVMRVAFNDIRMTGFDASQSTYKDVVFKNCKLNMANFRFSKFNTVRFEDCDLTEADFQNAELSNVVFRNCTLYKTQYSGARCKKVDLRSSQLFDLGGWQSLSGASIDSAQLMQVAGELAHELHITVSDE